MSEKNFDVIGLGSCTMDLIFSVEDIMRMELTDRDNIGKKYVAIENSSKLNVNSVKFFPGGSAANIACDLANIGFKTAYIGGVGTDSSGKACLEDMASHNVDTSGVKQFSTDSTAHSVILINSNYKDRSILAYKGANDLFSQEDVPDDKIKSTRCFAWTSLTSDKGIDAIKKCIVLAKEAGAIVAGAPSISIIKKRPDDAITLIKSSDITSMNDEELEAMTKTKDIIEGMKILFEWGLKTVNITLGKKGQWICDGKTLVKTTPPIIHVSDTTGAGDATMSGLIYGVLENKSLHDTAMIASSLSAMEIEATGVRVGLPEKYADLQKFIDSHTFGQETTNFV
jgi:sugar/nucleoside kinase (ribokinase family)